MKTQRITTVLLFIGIALKAILAQAQTQWNPTISETQKVAMLKELKEIQDKYRTNLWVEMAPTREGHPGTDRIICKVGVFGSTNVVLYSPLPSAAFAARLYDSNENEIRKTALGKKFGKGPIPDHDLLNGLFGKNIKDTHGHWRSRSRELTFTNAESSDYYWDFDVTRSFKIKEAGEYKLVVEVRLFVKHTNGVFTPLILPSVNRTVRILEKDLKRSSLF